jgi:hypothetical protein
MSRPDLGDGARPKSSSPVPHILSDSLLPGLQRLHGSLTLTAQGSPPRPLPARNVESHTSWYGYFHSTESADILGRQFMDRIDSRSPLGLLVATRALVSSKGDDTRGPRAVEPSAPGQTNSYIILIGRVGEHGFVIRANESERSVVEDIHALAVHRLQQGLAAGNETPEADAAREVIKVVQALGMSFTALR